jgi:hypothetical protein
MKVTHMSSRGEMKMSLSEMIYHISPLILASFPPRDSSLLTALGPPGQ